MIYTRVKASFLYGFFGCMVLLFSCQTSSQNEQKSLDGNSTSVLRINIGEDPTTIDPCYARNLPAITLVKMLFEGLTRIGLDGKVEKGLAESIDISDDYTRYTFTLKEAVWSNGDPITADDLIYAWKRVLNPKNHSANAFHLYPIKNAKAVWQGIKGEEELGIHKLDDKTFSVELEEMVPYFLELVAYPAYFPIHAGLDRENPDWAKEHKALVTSGPFMLKEWRSQNVIRVQKSPSYWEKEKVQLDEISMYMVAEHTELSLFENGDIDWAGSPLSTLPLDALKRLSAKKVVHRRPIMATYFLRLNTRDPLLSSPKMRRAISWSLNRKELTENVLINSQVPATGFIPDFFQIREESYFKDEDVQAAVKMLSEDLEERGLRRLALAKIELAFPVNERNQRIAQTIQARLKQTLGIEIALGPLESKIYFDKLYKGDFQMIMGSWFADYNDPLAFLEIFKTKEGGANYTQWESEEYRAFLEKAKHTVDSKERLQQLALSEKILIDESPIIPLFHYNLSFIKNEKLENVAISDLGICDFRWAEMKR